MTDTYPDPPRTDWGELALLSEGDDPTAYEDIWGLVQDEENWRALQGKILEEGTYEERPADAPFDGAKYHATDINTVFAWDESADQWTPLNTGTAADPVPGTTHLEAVTSGDVLADSVRSKSFPVIDVTHPAYGVAAGGDPARNRDGLQRALEDAFESDRRCRVRLPAGTIRIDGKVGFNRSEDTTCNVDLAGAGRRETTIERTDERGPVIELRTDAGNIRDCNIHDLRIRGGKFGLDLETAYYSDFTRLCFQSQHRHAEGVAINWRGGGHALCCFDNCWFVHTGNVFEGGSNGGARFENCLFGEDVGRLFAGGGRLEVVGCKFHAINGDRRDGHDGLKEMGDAIFDVASGGRLIVTDCTIELRETRLLNGDSNRIVTFTNNYVQSNHHSGDVAYFKSRGTSYDDTRMSVFQIEQNTFVTDVSPTIWAEVWDRETHPTKHSTFRDNTFVAEGYGVDFTIDSAFEADPTNTVERNHEAHPGERVQSARDTVF